MRRSIVGYMCGALVVVILLGVFALVDKIDPARRYHQHLEQPDEAELGVCSICGGAEFCTHLPIISIETGGAAIPGRPITNELGQTIAYETAADGSDAIWVSVSTIDRNGVWHHANDNPTHTSQASFHIRGNTSRHFDKPNYSVKLTNNSDLEQENPLPLLGMTASNEWALHGPFLDKTLMRNYVWMNISAEIMGYAPNVRFCELLLDGEYQGVYLLMETISVQDGRVDLTRYADGDPLMSYLVRLDYNVNPVKQLDDFSTYTRRIEIETGMEILYPGLRRQSEGVRNYIKTDLSEIEKAMYSLDVLKGSEVYGRLIDVDSFINYYIINEFLAVNDMFSVSTYLYKDVRGKLTVGPVWDFNNVLDNYILPMPARQIMLSQRGWYGRLMTDPAFVERVISRWRTLRKGVLSEKNLLEYTTEVELWLGSSVTRNYEVWGYSFDPEMLNPNIVRQSGNDSTDLTIYELNPLSYSDAMERMLEYLVDRGSWMDRHIDSLRQHSHDSRNTARGYY